MSDSRIEEYRQAVEALREGRFDFSLPTGGDDQLSLLGKDLMVLAEAMKMQSEQSAQLAVISQRINEGLLIDDVLDEVYESFFSVIPYDRIGLALLEDGKEVVRAYRARSEAPEIKLRLGDSAPWRGAVSRRSSGPGSRGSSTISRNISCNTRTRTRPGRSSRRVCVRA